MKTKDGVILCGLHPKMIIASACAAEIWIVLGKELVITEGVITRKDGGFHPLGRACDYRGRYFIDSDKYEAVRKLRDKLGNDYDVVFESDHIHCEYDPMNPKII